MKHTVLYTTISVLRLFLLLLLLHYVLYSAVNKIMKRQEQKQPEAAGIYCAQSVWYYILVPSSSSNNYIQDGYCTISRTGLPGLYEICELERNRKDFYLIKKIGPTLKMGRIRETSLPHFFTAMRYDEQCRNVLQFLF